MSKRSKLILFQKNTILDSLPEENVVYYLRGIADENSLYPVYYVGSAKRGEFRKKLLRQYFEGKWDDIVYVNYVKCSSAAQASSILNAERSRLRPKYNVNKTHSETLLHIRELNLNY